MSKPDVVLAELKFNTCSIQTPFQGKPNQLIGNEHLHCTYNFLALLPGNYATYFLPLTTPFVQHCCNPGSIVQTYTEASFNFTCREFDFNPAKDYTVISRPAHLLSQDLLTGDLRYSQ